MYFQDIIGQKRASSLLSGIAKHGRIANGYLFTGPVNSGQKEAAIAFARLVNCQVPLDNDGCGKCAPCLKFNKDIFPDLLSLEPLKQKIKIEQIKQLAARTVHGPYEGKWRFVIIDKAEKMTTESANCFLKLLEEPAERTTFILLTFNESALLPTIVSRCQKVNFNYLPRKAEETKEIDLPLHDLVQSSRLAGEIAVDKDSVREYLDGLLYHYYQKREFAKTKIILSCLRKMIYNVNIKLCLEDMFIKLYTNEQSSRKATFTGRENVRTA
ncbi:MAG: hypothetical protein WC838_03910 [Candidatus Margulisiibacteriota bacterium]|jgi:DNA polymerase III delta' subunit